MHRHRDLARKSCNAGESLDGAMEYVAIFGSSFVPCQ